MGLRLVRRSRCFTFAHPAERWAADLRGYDFFTYLRRGLAVRRLLGGHGRVQLTTGGTVRSCRDELLHIVMPGDPGHARYLEWRRAKTRHRATVVDVTADVLGLLDTPTEAMRRAADDLVHGNSPESLAFWARPESRRALTRCLVAADVVTTSWEALVAPLAELSGRPAFHVPDLRPTREGRERFTEALVAAYRAVER